MIRNLSRRKFNRQVRQYIEQLDFSKYGDISGMVLPELVAIPQGDALALIWQEQGFGVNNEDIRTLYDDPTLCPDGRSIPMDRLLNRLIDISNEKQKI